MKVLLAAICFAVILVLGMMFIVLKEIDAEQKEKNL